MDQSFFKTLYDSDDFSKSLGRLVMSSARFESCIKNYMDAEGKVEYSEKAPLGRLLRTLVDNHTIDRTSIEHFSVLLHERNYFVHRLHMYLSEYPSDAFQLKQFINRAVSTSEQMDFFSGLLEEAVCESA